MNLLIKFPTRGRRNKFLKVFNTYQKKLSGNNSVKFLISLDTDDDEMNSDVVKEVLSQYGNTLVIYGNSENKIHAVNRDIDKINEWDIVLLASDDMIPQVNGYDEVIITKMKYHYPDTDGVLFFNDGFQGNKLNTLCILGKKYYDRFGYIYYPEYKSTWCDNEFMDVANLLGKQTYFEEVIIKHEHPDWGYGSSDEIHKSNYENLNYDKNVYNKRKEVNFNL